MKRQSNLVVKKEKYRSVPPPSNPWKKEDKDIPFNLDNDFDVVAASIKPPVVLDEDALDTKRFLFDWFERQQRRVKKLTSKRKAVRKAEMTRFNFALREPLFTKTLLEKTAATSKEKVNSRSFQGRFGCGNNFLLRAMKLKNQESSKKKSKT